MPNFHIGGMSWVLVGLVRFATVVITADPTPGNMPRLIRQYAARRSFIVPTVLRAIVDDLRARNQEAPKMHGIYYGAMPIGESLLRDLLAVFDCKLGQYFGMTEVTGTAFDQAYDEWLPYIPPGLRESINEARWDNMRTEVAAQVDKWLGTAIARARSAQEMNRDPQSDADLAGR